MELLERNVVKCALSDLIFMLHFIYGEGKEFTQDKITEEVKATKLGENAKNVVGVPEIKLLGRGGNNKIGCKCGDCCLWG